MIGDYRPASFGGAPFYVSQTQDAFGRRGAHHEFPDKDRGLWDDLGGQDGRRQIEAYVSGFSEGGYSSARDRLMEALQKGEGELVHPWLGRHQVVCTDYSVGHDIKELGLCRISITFIDADTSAGEARANPVEGLMSGCDSALGALARLFAGGFSTEGVLSFVSETSFGRLDTLLEYVGQSLFYYREAEAALEPFIDAALARFGDRRGQDFSLSAYAAEKVDHADAERLTMAPDDLAQNILGLAGLLIPVSGTAYDAYQSLTGLWNLAGRGEPYQPSPKAASARSVYQINRNFEALDFLFQGAAAANAARLTPWLAFEHQARAAAVQADILARFDSLAGRAFLYDTAPGAADAFYQAGQTVTANALAIIAQTAPSLALLGRTTLPDTWPSVRLCYELYERLDREADLVGRNQVKHPGFLPGGVALEYLINV